MNFFKDLDKYASRIAIYSDRSKPISYKELLKDSDFVGNNIKKRSLVFILCRNDVETIVGYLGILRSDCVVALLDDKIDPFFLSNLIDKYKPRFIYLSSKNAELYSNTIHIIKKAKVICNYKTYNLIKTNIETNYSINDDLAFLITTSGSTGSSKFVRQSYNNTITNVKSIVEYLNIPSDNRAITTLPLSYTYGLSIVNTHLFMGAAIILTDASIMEKRFWDTFKKYKATNFGGVPYTYEMLKKLRFDQMDLPSLRYITQAGGKLSKELTADFTDICAKKRIKFIVMYGQTEASPRMSYLPWENAKDKIGSIGIAVPGGKFNLKDHNGNIIDTSNTSGELVYEGDNVTMGYAKDFNDLCKGDENNGILHTGDIAKYDADGFYYIVGRAKRFLKIFGRRINLDEVEMHLKNDNYECACSGIDDNLVVYVTNEDHISEIRNILIKRLGINPQAFTVKFIDKIPRNKSGKIQYSLLK